MFKKITSFALALFMLLTAVLPSVTADATTAEEQSLTLPSKQGTYYAYLEELGIEENIYPKADIKINALLFAEQSQLSKENVLEKEAVILENTGDKLTVNVTVSESGFYNVSLTYVALQANGSDIEYTFEIDGSTAFDGMKKLTR